MRDDLKKKFKKSTFEKLRAPEKPSIRPQKFGAGKKIIQYTNFVQQKLGATAAGPNLHKQEEGPPIDPHFEPVITFCPRRAEGGENGHQTAP